MKLLQRAIHWSLLLLIGLLHYFDCRGNTLQNLGSALKQISELAPTLKQKNSQSFDDFVATKKFDTDFYHYLYDNFEEGKIDNLAQLLSQNVKYKKISTTLQKAYQQSTGKAANTHNVNRLLKNISDNYKEYLFAGLITAPMEKTFLMNKNIKTIATNIIDEIAEEKDEDIKQALEEHNKESTATISLQEFKNLRATQIITKHYFKWLGIEDRHDPTKPLENIITAYIKAYFDTLLVKKIDTFLEKIANA